MLFANKGVEDNGNDDDEEEEEVKDVTEEVEGCSSGGRDENITRQRIHWIVVQDEILPNNNDLRKWQCNVRSPWSALFKYCKYTRACTKGVLFNTSMYKMYVQKTYYY
jgi:hypothetical protein